MQAHGLPARLFQNEDLLATNAPQRATRQQIAMQKAGPYAFSDGGWGERARICERNGRRPGSMLAVNVSEGVAGQTPFAIRSLGSSCTSNP
jgi:hypothetical protein